MKRSSFTKGKKKSEPNLETLYIQVGYKPLIFRIVKREIRCGEVWVSYKSNGAWAGTSTLEDFQKKYEVFKGF